MRRRKSSAVLDCPQGQDWLLHRAGICGTLAGVNAAVALSRLGGSASHAELVDAVGRAAVRRALTRHAIRRDAWGIYRLEEIDDARLAAVRLHGALALSSAALAHGWKVKDVPARPVVCVLPGRSIVTDPRGRVAVRRGVLSSGEMAARATAPVRTVIECARFLPFDEALAVADSALRARDVGHRELLDAAERSPRTGRAKAVRVVEAATELAANPMESVLRAICLDIPGLKVVPQVWVSPDERVDLADPSRGLIIEAESYEFHGSRDRYLRDVRRYTDFVRSGWVVLRFSWEDIMLRPADVRAVIVDVLRLAPERAQSLRVHDKSA